MLISSEYIAISEPLSTLTPTALNLKNLDYDCVPIHLVKNGGEQLADPYLKINPMGQVPALEVTDDSGEKAVLTQSVAIMEYLEELYPEVNLLPKDVQGRAKVGCQSKVFIQFRWNAYFRCERSWS